MKTKILLYTLVIFFSAFFLTGCTSDEAVDLSAKLVSQAKELHDKREYKASVEKYGEALEEYPANSEAYLGIVEILLEKGYLEDARNVALEASTRVSGEDSALLFVLVGDEYFANGDYEKALEMYEESLKEEKSFFQTNISLTELYIAQGELESATNTLGTVSGSDKNHYEYLILRTYLTLEDWEEGSKIIERVDIDEIEMEGPKEQVRVLREIYELDEEDLYKNTHLAKEYVNAGYPYLAIEILSNQSGNIEEYWDLQYFLGKAYLDYGEYEKALEKLNNAASLDVEDVNMYVNLARAYMFVDNVDRSVQAYKEAVSISDISEESYVVDEYVNMLVSNNMLSSARTVLTDLISDEYNYPWIYFLLCEVSYMQENMSQLLEHIEQLKLYEDLNAREERDLVRYELLYLMDTMQEFEKMLELVERYRVLDQYNSEIYLFEGKILHSKQENDSAVESLNRAVELDLEGEVTEEARRMLATIK